MLDCGQDVPKYTHTHTPLPPFGLTYIMVVFSLKLLAAQYMCARVFQVV